MQKKKKMQKRVYEMLVKCINRYNMTKYRVLGISLLKQCVFKLRSIIYFYYYFFYYYCITILHFARYFLASPSKIQCNKLDNSNCLLIPSITIVHLHAAHIGARFHLLLQRILIQLAIA